MRKLSRLHVFAVLAVVLAMGACSSSDSSSESAKAGDKPAGSSSPLGRILSSTTPVTIPEGTAIAITLDQALDSEQNKSGDSFDGSVSEAVVVNGKTVIPKGAQVQGTIVEAKESGRLKGVAVLRLALKQVEVDSKDYDVSTANVSFRGDSHTKRNVGMIGGGAGVGAAIGAIAGGGKGAAIGAGVGAGAGTAAAAATGKKDIKLPAETPLTFKLSQPVTVQVKG